MALKDRVCLSDQRVVPRDLRDMALEDALFREALNLKDCVLPVAIVSLGRDAIRTAAGRSGGGGKIGKLSIISRTPSPRSAAVFASHPNKMADPYHKI